MAAEVIEFGYYHKLLKQFYEYYPKAQVKVIRFEQITQHPQETMLDVYDFLGIDNSHQPQFMGSKFQVTAKSEITLKFRSLISDLSFEYSEDRSRFEPKQANEAEQHVLVILQQLYGKIVSPYLESQVTEVNPEIKQALLDLYLDDIGQLESELGWDLANWKQPS